MLLIALRTADIFFYKFPRKENLDQKSWVYFCFWNTFSPLEFLVLQFENNIAHKQLFFQMTYWMCVYLYIANSFGVFCLSYCLCLICLSLLCLTSFSSSLFWLTEWFSVFSFSLLFFTWVFQVTFQHLLRVHFHQAVLNNPSTYNLTWFFLPNLKLLWSQNWLSLSYKHSALSSQAIFNSLLNAAVAN